MKRAILFFIIAIRAEVSVDNKDRNFYIKDCLISESFLDINALD